MCRRAAVAEVGFGEGVRGVRIGLAAANLPQPIVHPAGPAAGFAAAEFQSRRQAVDQVQRAPAIALLHDVELQQHVRGRVPQPLDRLAQRAARHGAFQRLFQPNRREQDRPNVIEFAERGDRGRRQIAADIAFEFREEAADQFDDQRVAQARGIAIFAERERIEDVAVPRGHAMPTQRVEQFFILGGFVRERLIVLIRQAQVMGDLVAENIELAAAKMQRPIGVADHVVNAHRQRQFVRRIRRLVLHGRLRNGHEAFGRDRSQPLREVGVLAQRVVDDARDGPVNLDWSGLSHGRDSVRSQR